MRQTVLMLAIDCLYCLLWFSSEVCLMSLCYIQRIFVPAVSNKFHVLPILCCAWLAGLSEVHCTYTAHQYLISCNIHIFSLKQSFNHAFSYMCFGLFSIKSGTDKDRTGQDSTGLYFIFVWFG